MTTILALRSGPSHVRIAPQLGGRITSAALGHGSSPIPIVHPYPETALDLLPWAKGGIYPLVPYSGRIRNAQLMHEGRIVELAPHPGGEPHTLHGVAHQRPWDVEKASEDAAVMHYRHAPDAHWPWSFESSLGVVLRADALRIGISLINTGQGAMPGGIGLHPYLPYMPGDELLYEADPPWPYDGDFLACDPPVGPRSGQTVSDGELAAGDVTRFHAGVCELVLRRRAGPGLRMTTGECLRHLVIHRPAGSSYACIEPVSHVADGFNLSARGVAGTGTRILRPGEQMTGHLEIQLCGRD
jgi:aldose 1-epimerase